MQVLRVNDPLCSFWLVLEWVKLTIQHEHRLGSVLVGMVEVEVAECEVESKHHEGHGTEHGFVKWHSLDVSLLMNT